MKYDYKGQNQEALKKQIERCKDAKCLEYPCTIVCYWECPYGLNITLT